MRRIGSHSRSWAAVASVYAVARGCLVQRAQSGCCLSAGYLFALTYASSRGRGVSFRRCPRVLGPACSEWLLSLGEVPVRVSTRRSLSVSICKALVYAPCLKRQHTLGVGKRSSLVR